MKRSKVLLKTPLMLLNFADRKRMITNFAKGRERQKNRHDAFSGWLSRRSSK